MSQVIALGPAARMLTTREAALRLGVSLRTIQLWVEASILPAARTPGGHRRIPYNAVEALAMNMGLADQVPASAVERTQQSISAVPVDVVRPEPDAVSSSSGPAKVVLVSKDEAWLQACASALEVYGRSVDVHMADNGYVALLMIGQEAPQLLVTTLELPGMDGQEMLRTLDRFEVLSRMHVLVLMPDGQPLSVIQDTLPGGIELMPWPVSPDALAIKVGRWLLTRPVAPDAPHD